MQYPWGVQYRGGYHDKCEGILSTMEDTQYHGDIMKHVEGYHEYCESVQFRGGTQITKDFPPRY